MYKSFIIVQENLINPIYSFHSSISYEYERQAINSYSSITDIIIFKITLKAEDNNTLINNLYDIFTRDVIDENFLILILWYIQYYLKHNNIQHKVLINNKLKFNFMDSNNV